MAHLVLLGASTFDNARYTAGEPDVIAHVRKLLPTGWTATLLAVDGASTAHISSQLLKVPSDASHLVLSVGGYDVLAYSTIFESPTQKVSHALAALADISRDFEDKYRSAVEACRKLGRPLTICTIYNGCFPDGHYQRIASTGLTVFNDVILRIGIEFSLSMIDLRFICSTTADYANPIVPSAAGGAKIARAIVNVATAAPTESPCARVVIA